MENYKKRIRKSFDNSSDLYDENSLIQQEVANRLIDRLKYLKFKPLNILDIGSGTGYLAKKLQLFFPEAKLFCLDLSENMSVVCKSKNKDMYVICGDAEFMPLINSSFDLVISSFTFHWCKNIKKIFSDVRNILKENGIFIFSTVGPDTLIELKNTFKKIDNHQHVNNFSDMHTFGDLLLSVNFSDPVMDVDRITVKYKTLNELLKSLKNTGSNIVMTDERKFLGHGIISKIRGLYQQNIGNNVFPATYEIIYAIAWKNLPKNFDVDEKVIQIKKI